MGKPSSVKQRSKFFRSYVMFHPHKKSQRNTARECRKWIRKIFYFLDTAEGLAISRWRMVREEKVKGMEKICWTWEREREKYERKWIKKEGRPEELLVGMKTCRNSVQNYIGWRVRGWLHWQNTVQGDSTDLQCSVCPWCLVIRWFSAGKDWHSPLGLTA